MMPLKPAAILGIIAALAIVAIVWVNRSEQTVYEAEGEGVEAPLPGIEPVRKEQEEVVADSLPEEPEADTQPPITTAQPPMTDISGPVPLVDSPIVQQWMELEGYTRQDILDAQEFLRNDGYSPEEVEDPGNVRRHLPPRHVSSVIPTSLVVPDRAVEGEPISFVLEGRVPDPSFTFTRFIIQQQGPVLLIRANGHSDGHMVAAYEGETEAILLPGELPPLPPGDYRVEILELGPHGSFPLTVVPRDP